MIEHIVKDENLLSTIIIEGDVEVDIGRLMKEYMTQIMRDINKRKYEYLK